MIESKFAQGTRQPHRARQLAWAMILLCSGLVPLSAPAVALADGLSLSLSLTLSPAVAPLRPPLDGVKPPAPEPRPAPTAATEPPPAPPANASAPPPQAGVAPLAWSDALRLAAQQSALVRAAAAQADAQGSVARQAWAEAYMPRVDLTAQLQQDRVQTRTYTTRTPSSNAGVQATLPIWHGADQSVEQSQLALTERANWQTRLTRMNVAREVSRAYLQAVEAAAQLDLVEEQRALLTAHLHINDERLRGGVGTSLERLETATRLDLLRADMHDRLARFEAQRLALGRLLGQDVAAVARLAPQSGLGDDAGPTVVEPTGEALARIPERSPAVQDALAQVRAAQALVKARDAESWEPKLDAVASLARNRQVTKAGSYSESLSYTESTLGVQLNVPLYTGGRQPGRQGEAAALLIKAEAERDDALAKAQADLLTAYQGLDQARLQVRALRDVERTALATVTALQRAFVAGYRSNVDLLTAQQQLIAVRSQSATARINVLLAQVEILSLTERLDADAVAPLAPLLTAAAPASPPNRSSTRLTP